MSADAPSKKQYPPAVAKDEQPTSTKSNPSPDEEHKDDIRLSLKQVRAGQVIDADQSVREIRRELGIDAN